MQKDVVQLGKKLVEELELGDDITSQWMAVYISEQINKSRNASGEDKDIAEKRCYDAILGLWEKRYAMQKGSRPFEDLESIVRIIESLNPDKNSFHYFHSVCSSMPSGIEDTEIKIFLECIKDIDYSAKVMIGRCLMNAAHHATNKYKKWIELVRAANLDDTPMNLLLEFTEDSGKEEKRIHLEKQLQRVKNFIEIATVFTNSQRKIINELSCENKKDNTSKTSAKKKAVKSKTTTNKRLTEKKKISRRTTAKAKMLTGKNKIITKKSKKVSKS